MSSLNPGFGGFGSLGMGGGGFNMLGSGFIGGGSPAIGNLGFTPGFLGGGSPSLANVAGGGGDSLLLPGLGAVFGTLGGLFNAFEAARIAEERVFLTDQRIKRELMWEAQNEVLAVEEIHRKMYRDTFGLLASEASVNSLSYQESVVASLAAPLIATEQANERRRRFNEVKRLEAADVRQQVNVPAANIAFDVFTQGMQGFQAGLQLQDAIDRYDAAQQRQGALSAAAEDRIDALGIARQQGRAMFNQRMAGAVLQQAIESEQNALDRARSATIREQTARGHAAITQLNAINARRSMSLNLNIGDLLADPANLVSAAAQNRSFGAGLDAIF